MRCQKHASDISSGVGVCATCLREKLFTLVAAQSRHILQQQFQAPDDRRRSDVDHPPLVFPRSVSPYVSRRNSDSSSCHHHHHRRYGSVAEQRFYFTPEIGPNGKIDEENEYYSEMTTKKKKTNYRFSFFNNLFRSNPDKRNSDAGASNSGDPRIDSSSSASWISSILGGCRKKQHCAFSVDESTTAAKRRSCRHFDRGLSPVRYCEDFVHEHCGSSGYSSESSQGWKRTPRRTPALAPGRRAMVPRNISGMTFCLSPLVRASPNRQWNQKNMPPEMMYAGDIRAPAKSPMMLCKNGSKKIADLGRVNRNRRYRNSS